MQGDFSHKALMGGGVLFFFLSTLLLLRFSTCTDLQIPMGSHLPGGVWLPT